MSSERILLSLAAAACAVVSLAALACGPSAPDIPTVPPAPTATTAPVATSAPDPTRASGDAQAQTPPAVPSVPHRAYNALGDANAPIVMYDYSDFT